MKKLFVAFALICSAFAVSAQRAGDATAWNDKQADDSEFNHSGIFLNPGIGVVTGDCDTGFGFSFNMGYRWHIASGFSWDIVKVGINTDVINFTDMLDARFMSGFRYNTPVLFSDKGLYVDFAVGYQFMTRDTALGGVAYEVGAGFNLTRTVSLGLVWEGSSVSDEFYTPYYGWSDVKYSWGMFGVRLGLNF